MLALQQPYNQLSEHDERVIESLLQGINGDMCEVGCWTGHSTSILARHAKNTGKHLFVVDNFKGNEGTPLFDYANEQDVEKIFIDNMKELNLFNVITLLNMNSINAHCFINNKSLSFIFVDASHKYLDVKNDIINYLDKLKDGGIICGHDYESETYDERYVDEDYVDGKHHGVIKAVNEVFGKVEYDGRMWWVK